MRAARRPTEISRLLSPPLAGWVAPQPTSCSPACTWFAPLGLFAVGISLLAAASAVASLAPATREKQTGPILLVAAAAGSVLWVLTALALLWIFKTNQIG